MWASYGHGFSQILRQVRLRRRLSQTALAEIAGLSRNHICNLEKNDTYRNALADPTLSTVYKLALALEVPPALLLPGAGDSISRVWGWTDPELQPELQPEPQSQSASQPETQSQPHSQSQPAQPHPGMSLQVRRAREGSAGASASKKAVRATRELDSYPAQGASVLDSIDHIAPFPASYVEHRRQLAAAYATKRKKRK